jgi:hypothetical protein
VFSKVKTSTVRCIKHNQMLMSPKFLARVRFNEAGSWVDGLHI